MSTAMLPADFAAWEPYAAKWCKATEDERWDERLATPFTEVEELYRALAPRAEEAIQYCDKFELDAMPDDVRNLMYLLCSLIQASFPVECWKQVRVPDTGAAKVDCILEPAL